MTDEPITIPAHIYRDMVEDSHTFEPIYLRNESMDKCACGYICKPGGGKAHWDSIMTMARHGVFK